MQRDNKDREELKQELIQRIGPWAFYSFNRKYWSEMSDRQIIEGALIHAPVKEKFMLLDIYDISLLKAVWEEYIVIQAEWHKDANLWVAENIFKISNAEGFIKEQRYKSQKLRLKKGISF